MSKSIIILISLLLAIATPFIVTVNFWELSTTTYVSSVFSILLSVYNEFHSFKLSIFTIASFAVLFPTATIQLLIQIVLKCAVFFYVLFVLNKKFSASWLINVAISLLLLGVTHAGFYYYSLSVKDISDSRTTVTLREEFKANVYVGMSQEDFEAYLESHESIRDFGKLYYTEFDDGSYNIADYYAGSKKIEYTLGKYILNGDSYDGISAPEVYFKDGVIIGVFGLGELNSQSQNDLFKSY